MLRVLIKNKIFSSGSNSGKYFSLEILTDRNFSEDEKGRRIIRAQGFYEFLVVWISFKEILFQSFQ